MRLPRDLHLKEPLSSLKNSAEHTKKIREHPGTLDGCNNLWCAKTCRVVSRSRISATETSLPHRAEFARNLAFWPKLDKFAKSAVRVHESRVNHHLGSLAISARWYC